MKKKVILSVTNDLLNEQRVNKVAKTLQKNGFEVLLVGRELPESEKPKLDYKYKRFKLLFNKGPLFYICYNIRLFLFLLFEKFDILNANDLDTLPANYLISVIKSKKLVYDSHEYFTEVPELINRKTTRNIWLLVEKFILPRLKYCYTVSPSIATAYKQKYNVDFKVIMNLPFKIDVPDNVEKDIDIIYQGALNVGRGLEVLIYTAAKITDLKVVIVGDGDIREYLETLVDKLGIYKRVIFTGKIDFETLKTYTLRAKIGVSLEQDMGLNYRYALPNKMFDYVNAEIPSIISSLPEMKNVNDKYGFAYVLHKTDIKHLTDAILTLLGNKNFYNQLKQNAIEAKNELNWSNQEKDLLDIYRLEI